jgi:hypothetical protein
MSSLTNQASRDEKVLAIDSALAFLSKRQLVSGMFSSIASTSLDLRPVAYVNSVYIPTYIVHALQRVRNHPVASQTIRATVKAILREKERRGLWRFFGPGSISPPPDFDDTCCALAALKEASVEVESDVFVLLTQNLAPSGGFYTCTDLETNQLGGYHVDAAVNANILFYAGLCGLTLDGPTQLLNTYALKKGFRHFSNYSISEYSVIYLLMRAYRDGGVSELKPSVAPAVHFLLQSVCSDASWGNELDTALGLTALINAGYIGEECESAASWLLGRQLGTGGWPAWPFFQDFLPTYYASEELTTSLCVEALSKWSGPRLGRVPHFGPVK